jgi:heme/copper-type cytochrome/quinol oxidase subunit 3
LNAATAHAATHPPTATGLDTFKLGFWVFLGSETLFFGSLISTYMVYKGHSVVGPYPADVLDIPLTTLSTFVLLASSFLMVIGLWGVQSGRRRWAHTGLLGTVTFGCIFLGFQAYEFTEFYHAGLSLQQNLFGSSFFVLTGFHGAHVTVGVMWLLILWIQFVRGRIGSWNALNVEIAGLYWHFVDIVWIAIFTLVYLMM